MNKSIAVIRHIDVEGLGSIEDVLKDKGLSYTYIDTGRDPLPSRVSDYHAVVILGGPMGVYEQDKYPFIKKELFLIEQARRLNIPVIGICLGSQMIAQALGGRVYKGGIQEIGWYDIQVTKEASHDKLFSSVHAAGGESAALKVFQWHGDTFDLPGDAVLLASSKLYKNQAFRVGTIYGLQFHIEVKEADIKRWISEYKAELDTLGKSMDVNKILGDTRKYIDVLNETSKEVFSAFFGLIS
jgi:GMP synthase-like glutamine amidotransferase